MKEFSTGSVRVHKGKWQGLINYRDSPDDSWHQISKNLKCYHQPHPTLPNTTVEVTLAAPKGRVTKAMKEAAMLALKEWRDELLAANGICVRTDYTVAGYIDHYLDVQERGQFLERSTIADYRKQAKLIAGRNIGNVKLAELTYEDAESFIAELVEDGYAPTRIRRVYNVLHPAVKHAVKSHILKFDPIASVKTPTIKYKDPNSLDDESRAKLVAYLDVAGATPVNVGIALALYTGMREGEICGLRWRDVDLENRIIHVRTSIAHDRNTCYEKQPKTRAGIRDIPYSEDVERFLMNRLNSVRKDSRAAYLPFDKDWFVIGEIGDGTGTFMNPHDLWHDWKALVKSLGLVGTQGKAPTFHDLRHTNATVATHMPNTDLKSVQLNLGHSSIKTTLDIYASDNPESRRGIAEKTSAAIRSVPKASQDTVEAMGAIEQGPKKATRAKRPTRRSASAGLFRLVPDDCNEAV